VRDAYGEEAVTELLTWDDIRRNTRKREERRSGGIGRRDDRVGGDLVEYFRA